MLRALMPALLLVSALLCAVPASAFLADDFSQDHLTGRMTVGGELVPTPSGLGKSWDGGRGWRSRMRYDAILEQFYGRRDFVVYRGLVPGRDLPVEAGSLELWFRRVSNEALPSLNDNLVQFLDGQGETLATFAVDYGAADRAPNLNLWKVADVWGEVFPLPPVAVDEWVHLAFTWGPGGSNDNRLFMNGRELTTDEMSRSGDFSRILQRTESIRFGLGWDDSDPAYRTVIDEFRFSGEIRRAFDLDRSLFAPQESAH